jgi:hypothetical protein
MKFLCEVWILNMFLMVARTMLTMLQFYNCNALGSLKRLTRSLYKQSAECGELQGFQSSAVSSIPSSLLPMPALIIEGPPAVMPSLLLSVPCNTVPCSCRSIQEAYSPPPSRPTTFPLPFGDRTADHITWAYHPDITIEIGEC